MPASIAVPFLAVARHLDIPPVATYAAENLWNFEPIDPRLSIEDPDNFRALTTFTGTGDESWFYSIPAAIEMRGRHIIPLVLGALDAVEAGNVNDVVECLSGIAAHLRDLTLLLPRMYEKNSPSVFYNRIRPFLAGTTSADLPDGVFYEDGKGGGEFVKLKGPTAAQSSLFHLLDEALGVRHESTGQFLQVSSYTGENYTLTDLEQEMRSYMPAPHRRLLALVATKVNIRDFVESSTDEVCLQEAYNHCLAALANYRTKHLQMVSRYIVIPSREALGSKSVVETEPGTAGRVASCKVPTDAKRAEAKKQTLGTGGTAPIEFLKSVRSETRDGILKK